MEVANADGFVFKRRRKESAGAPSTSAQPPAQVPHVEETHYNRYGGARVQEEDDDAQQVNVVYGARAQGEADKGRRRRRTSSFVQEEFSFPPYPVGGAIILPADGDAANLEEGDKLVKLCHEVASTECRNVSRTFVGKAEEVSHLVYTALESFEDKVKAMVTNGDLNFLSKTTKELNTKKETMQRLVESLEAELKSWSEIKDSAPQTFQDQSYQANEEEGRLEVKTQSAEGRLAGAYNKAVTALDAKVNDLCGLVKSVESLCGQTERYTKDLQTKYHKQTFHTLPHVNSPATLIKTLLKPAV